MAPGLSSSASSRLLQTQNALNRFRYTSRVSCSRCRGRNEDCLIDAKSVRCKKCLHDKKKCDLRVTFDEFERMARERLELANRLDAAEKELEQAESEALLASERVKQARQKAKHVRQLYRTSDRNESGAYLRELASIEIMEQIELELLQHQSNSDPNATPTQGQQSFSDISSFPSNNDIHSTCSATPLEPWPVSEDLVAWTSPMHGSNTTNSRTLI